MSRAAQSEIFLNKFFWEHLSGRCSLCADLFNLEGNSWGSFQEGWAWGTSVFVGCMSIHREAKKLETGVPGCHQGGFLLGAPWSSSCPLHFAESVLSKSPWPGFKDLLPVFLLLPSDLFTFLFPHLALLLAPRSLGLFQSLIYLSEMEMGEETIVLQGFHGPLLIGNGISLWLTTSRHFLPFSPGCPARISNTTLDMNAAASPWRGNQV